VYRAHFTAFTTPCEIHVDVTTKKEGIRVITALLPEIQRLQTHYSYFSPTSQIYAINHRTSDTLHISPELASLLNLALFYTHITYGAFDIAFAGTLKQAYRAKSVYDYQHDYDALMPFASATCMHLEDTMLHFSNQITQIDLGGIVKEYAVDQMIMQLQKMGIASALVNFGGDVAAYGTHGEAQWCIGIQDPKDETRNITTFPLENASLCTSGHSKRCTTIEGKHFSHIILSDKAKLSQVSMCAPTTVDAGIWSLAFLINPLLELPAHVKKVLVL